MAIEGRKPDIVVGMRVVMDDGSMRKVSEIVPGEKGEKDPKTVIKFVARKGKKGTFGRVPQEVMRRGFWKGVENVA